MKKYENKISMVSPMEGENSKNMCEIRFDCLVTMYEMAQQKQIEDLNVFFRTEKRHTPQWFKSQSKITLEAIKYSDEYYLGSLLKDMLFQMEDHIRKFENNEPIQP